jgi:hypothetical protein
LSAALLLPWPGNKVSLSSFACIVFLVAIQPIGEEIFFRGFLFEKIENFIVEKIDEKGSLAAEESYRDLKQYFISHGQYNDASWASYREKTMERNGFWRIKILHTLSLY